MQRSFTTKYSPPVEVKANLNEAFARYDVSTNKMLNSTMDTDQLLTAYKSVAPLKTAMDMLTRAVSSIPLKLVNLNDDTIIKVHPLLDVLKKPNVAYQKTMTQFFAAVAFWKVLSGDAYIIVTGRTTALEMYAIRSVDVTVRLDSVGFIDYYEYRTANSGLTERYQRDQATGRYLSSDKMREMLHISSLMLDPSGTDQGAISDIAALRQEIEQYVQVARHNVSLLSNGGRPSGALVLPVEAGTLDAKSRAELQRNADVMFTGANNAGRIMLLEGGLQWQNFATSPKDGDFNTTKADAEAQIFKAVGVPLDLAGNSKAVSANNMVNIRREFYKSRVVPLMNDMLEFLNNFLLPRYGNNTKLALQVDIDKIDVFVEERTAMMALIENSTARTPNEKRKAQGLPADLEGGDNLYDPNGRFIAGPDAEKFTGTNRVINAPSVATP